MKVLIACEESQAVCKEFRRQGHEAYSCDVLPCSGGHPEWHIQGDVSKILNDGWDMIIAFPPCTYLCSSGLHWNKRVPERAQKTEEALKFVEQIMNADCPRIALENPIGCISTRIRKPDQKIQPYEFGDDASKKTCLWLKGLEPLQPTNYVAPRVTAEGKERWGNQSDDGQNRDIRTGKVLAWNSQEIKTLRSKTYPGIAKAMGEQWKN